MQLFNVCWCVLALDDVDVSKLDAFLHSFLETILRQSADTDHVHTSLHFFSINTGSLWQLEILSLFHFVVPRVYCSIFTTYTFYRCCFSPRHKNDAHPIFN